MTAFEGSSPFCAVGSLEDVKENLFSTSSTRFLSARGKERLQDVYKPHPDPRSTEGPTFRARVDSISDPKELGSVQDDDTFVLLLLSKPE